MTAAPPAARWTRRGFAAALAAACAAGRFGRARRARVPVAAEVGRMAAWAG